jgi:hypothetical protein
MRRATLLAIALCFLSRPSLATDPPEFDPNDLTVTHAWIVTDRDANPLTKGNALATKQANEKHQATLDTMKGKMVKWVVTVERVESDGMIAVKADRHTRGKSTRNSHFINLENALPPKPRGGRPAESARFTFPPKNPGEWVTRLTPGSKITLSGTINDVSHSAQRVTIRLTKATVSP